MKLPENYNTVMPYLILKDASGFIDFTEKLFGAKLLHKFLNEDNSIMHAEIKIGDSTIMIGGSSEGWKSQPAGLYINIEDTDKLYKQALELGAESILEPEDKDYGRAAGIKDPFGNTWWMTSSK